MKKILFIIPFLFILASCTETKKIDVNPPTPTSQIEKQVSSTEEKPVMSSTPMSKDTKMLPTPFYGSGKNLIEIFADFQCPACQNFTKNFEPVLKEFADKGMIRIEYRQFPLDMHKNAIRDALSALCSAEQGKYMEGKSAIYDLEISKKQAPVSDAERVEALVKAGIDRVELEKCLETDRYLDQVDNDVQLGESRRVNGTPTVFLDGKRIDNAFFRDPDTFKMNLERIRSPQ